jgi:predicted PurR-regulated permease PerM
MLNQYLALIVLALIFADLFQPIYKKIMSWTNDRKGISLALVIVIFLLIIVIPLTIAGFLAIYEVNRVIEFVNNWNKEQALTLEQMIDRINGLADKIPYVELQLSVEKLIDYIRRNVQAIGNFLASNLIQAGGSLLSVLARLTSFFFTFGASLIYLDDIRKFIYAILPLEKKASKNLTERLLNTGKSMLKSMFIVASVQGILAGVTLALLGVRFPIFWGMLALIFSIIPLGSGFILVPIAAVLLATGQILKAILLIFSTFVIIGSADNILRPYLASSSSSLHPMFILIGMLGGVASFGFWGLVFGPMIVSFTIGVLKLYKEKVSS